MSIQEGLCSRARANATHCCSSSFKSRSQAGSNRGAEPARQISRPRRLERFEVEAVDRRGIASTSRSVPAADGAAADNIPRPWERDRAVQGHSPASARNSRSARAGFAHDEIRSPRVFPHGLLERVQPRATRFQVVDPEQRRRPSTMACGSPRCAGRRRARRAGNWRRAQRGAPIGDGTEVVDDSATRIALE